MNPAQRFPARRSRPIRTVLASAVILAALAACESAGPRRSARGEAPGDGAAAAVIPRMEARGTFFDGRIEAEVLLARVGAHWKRQDDTAPATGRREAGGGGFSGRVGGFGGGHGGHRGGGGRGGGGEGGGESDAPSRTPIHASNLPAAALRLRLTNHGDAPVAVEVVDFDSSLGDFVVEPEKIALPPDTPTEAEPMISRLGIGTEDIPLTVRLRLGGRGEQQVLTLREVSQPAPGSPAPTAPPAGPDRPD